MTFKNKKDYIFYLKNRPVNIEKKEYWSAEYFDKKLADFDIIRPRMPLQDNAKYEDWRIYFERFIPELNNNVILIGSSLGGIFLAKYLSENNFPKKIKALFLVAPPYDANMSEEDLVGGFRLKSDLSLIEKNVKNIHFFFSEDDLVVTPYHAKQYAKKLKNAKITYCSNKNGHFRVSEFPEIVKEIKLLNK